MVRMINYHWSCGRVLGVFAVGDKTYCRYITPIVLGCWIRRRSRRK